MPYPKMLRLRQRFERPRVDEITAAVNAALEKIDLGQVIRPGQTVALTAGSRGIANIPQILQATVAFLRKLGAQPFIVPAMGSHVGGAPQGQRDILEGYGPTWP